VQRSPQQIRNKVADMIVRLSKALMCLSLALLGLLVAYDNVIDYGTNDAFVHHVLGMDTVFPDSVLRSRAITDPTLLRLGYAGIIAGEALTGLLLLVGGLSMLRNARNPVRFDRSKAWIFAGGTIGFLVWFLGFMVVGGEWFQMWQSQTWNGQQPAFRFYMTILVVLIYVQQPERDLLRSEQHDA
jgi:predicted small integral membrane protein